MVWGAASVALWAIRCPGQVVINELSAVASDRLLVRENVTYPQVGHSLCWQAPAFDDSRWRIGHGPFGFGSFSGVTLATDLLGEMLNRTPSLYLRRKFTVTPEQANSPALLQLLVRYNDGFIAFINGKEIARRNLGNPGMFAFRDQLAFNAKSPSPLEPITLPAANTLLTAGENVLAIQAHNHAMQGGYAADFLIQADLNTADGTPLVAHSDAWRYFPGHAEPAGGLIDHGRLSQFINEQTVVLWAARFFNDSKWPVGTGPVGIEGDDPPHYALGTNLYHAAFSNAPSLYTRLAFNATSNEAVSVSPLRLTLDYDDAVIVYLNGREVARRNIGVIGIPTAFDALANSPHDANGDHGTVTGAEEVINLAPASVLLQPGHNVLGVQIHRHSLDSADAIARVTLESTGPDARVLAQPGDAVRFFVGNREPLVDDGDEEYSVLEEPSDSENDWIELCNLGGEDVHLGGWSLSDNPNNPRKWVFPNGTTLPAGGFLVVMATGLDTGPADGADFLHANFKLSSAGEYVGLFEPSGAVADAISPAFPPQRVHFSYARGPEGGFAFRAVPTPGATNDPAPLSLPPAAPEFSLPGGHYPGALMLSLTSDTPGAAIRYLVGGEEPTWTRGDTYVSALHITSNCIIRARSFVSGAVPSQTVTHTYLLAQSAARRSLPALCLGGDPTLTYYGPNATNGPVNGEGIFAIKGGIYSVEGLWSPTGDTAAFNIPRQTGRFTEKPATLEFLPLTGQPLRTALGVRLAGSPYSRPRFRLDDAPTAPFSISIARKPSFNLFFRNDFGGTRPQNYPFFADSPVTRFQDLRLRAGKNDMANPFITDEFMRRTFIGTGQKGGRGIITALYLNGVFKGYFNLCERLREGFMQEHHGSGATWDVQQANDFASGDPVHWNQTVAFLRSANLSHTAAYAQVHDYLDVDNFIDYLLVNIYGATGDWPYNNWVASRERTPQGRWRFYMWDAEIALGIDAGRGPATYNTLVNDLDIGAEALTTVFNYIPAFYTLLKNSPEFRLRFADRAQKHFFNGGCLTRERLEALYFELRTAVRPIIEEVYGQPMNEQMYTNWIVSDVRRVTVLTQLAAAGLWPAVAAPIFSQHGGVIPGGSPVSLTNPNDSGTIYFTTDGSDPRTLGGGIAGQAYSAPLFLPASAQIQARVRHADGEWSPVVEASFVVPAPESVFLPGSTADWTVNANWSGGTYPNAPGATARIDPPASADRNADLRAPVTVGAIRFPQGDSAFRNRVRGQGDNNTLTFQTPNGHASIEVGGTGAGYVEFDVEGGVVLASDVELRVDNLIGHPDHGALRLRSGWSGGGGLIKTGPGRASLTGENKLFTGPVTVAQGVLAITGPAAPAQCASVAVEPGGQLRLISGGDPRWYDLGGQLLLEGTGRGAEVPDNSGEGKRGALRFDPPSSGNHAFLEVPVHVTGPAVIHVEGVANRLELASILSGDHALTKSGGGVLRLSGQNPGFTPALVVENGVLELAGSLSSPISLSGSSVLRGYGSCGSLDGPGSVELDATIITAEAAQTPHFAFVFRQTGTPNFNTAADAGNGLLRLRMPTLVTPAIDLYLATPAPDPDASWRGGFFVSPDCGLHQRLESANVRVFRLEPAGPHQFLGVNWSLDDSARVLAVNQTADFGDGPVAGHTLEVRLPSQVTYETWRWFAFADPNERDNPAVSGPHANPDGDRHNNFLEYALAINPLIPDGPGYAFNWVATQGDIYPAITFTRPVAAADLHYVLLGADELTGPWLEVTSTPHASAPTEPGVERVVFRDSIPAQPAHRFLRLQVSSP